MAECYVPVIQMIPLLLYSSCVHFNYEYIVSPLSIKCYCTLHYFPRYCRPVLLLLLLLLSQISFKSLQWTNVEDEHAC